MKLICKNPNCTSFIEVFEPTSPSVTYTCRNHTKKANDKVRFQNNQFDKSISGGTDPKAYEQGLDGGGKGKGDRPFSASERGHKKKRERIKKAEQILVDHQNAVEILSILKEDVRDHNS